MMRIRDYDLLLTWKLTHLIPDLCVYVILNVMRLLCQLLSGPLPLRIISFLNTASKRKPPTTYLFICKRTLKLNRVTTITTSSYTIKYKGSVSHTQKRSIPNMKAIMTKASTCNSVRKEIHFLKHMRPKNKIKEFCNIFDIINDRNEAPMNTARS